MNKSAEITSTSSAVDTFKLGLSVLIVAASIVGFYWFEQESVLYRSLALTGLVLLALGIVYTSRQGKAIVQLFGESRREVKRVVWPTRSETTQTTLLVLVFTMIIGIILFLLDLMLNWLFSFFIVT